MELIIQELGHTFAEQALLSDLNLRLPSGSSLAICGPSGSGKSSLLHILGGLLPPTTGQILWQTTDPYQLSRRKREQQRRRQVSSLLQGPLVFPSLSVWDNILLPTAFTRIAHPEAQARRWCQPAGLEPHLQQAAGTLSGGQRVRLALIRCLLYPAPLVLLDEPTAALDQQTSEQVCQLINTMHAERSCTLVCATHDPLVTALCQQHLELAP